MNIAVKQLCINTIWSSKKTILPEHFEWLHAGMAYASLQDLLFALTLMFATKLHIKGSIMYV